MGFMTDTHYYEGKKTTFLKTGLRVAALVFSPEDFDEHASYPAIVVTHPGGVKEQVASLYAWNLSQKGYVTIAFDASHHGESEGMPRYLEDPASVSKQRLGSVPGIRETGSKMDSLPGRKTAS